MCLPMKHAKKLFINFLTLKATVLDTLGMILIQGYQFADDDYEAETKEEDEVLKVEIVTSSKPQEEVIPPLIVKDESKKVTSKLTSDPMFEDDLYNDGKFTYDQVSI